MLHSTEKMDVDLSIVKQEGLVDDYGQNNGNILDNFIAEHDYHDFPQSVPSVSSMDEEGVNVDWLSSFFDEPGLHSHMSSGLNPPLSDLISSAAPTTKSKDTLTSGASSFLDVFPTYSDDYRNLCESNSLKSPLSPTSPTLRNCNPLLCQPTENIKSHEIKQEVVYDIAAETKSAAQTVTVQSPTALQTTQQVRKLNDNSKPMLNKTEKQQKLLLFMNTPENRAKLAGTNFNIVNANLLSKITGQNSNTEPYKKPMNVIQLKKCIQLNNTLKQSISTANDSNKTINCSPKIIVNTQNGITDILQSSLGIIKKETTESIEVDSGYESPNSTESPGSPPLDIEKAAYDSYIDVPPQDRHPFYLSEEEKRTLIIEGLPVPATLPLNKMEERALKKVRRKIKNKISAQESRRKKKEYMEALEKRVDTYANENNVLKKKMSNLEVANRSLILQVQKLQAMLNNNKKIDTNNQDVLVT